MIRIANGTITCPDDWKRLAPPKRLSQWREGRSAFELAAAWCGSGQVTMPPELIALLDSREETRGMRVEDVTPECRIQFDERQGEPRNAHVAFVGETSTARIAVTVEAKADETFGDTVGATLSGALERLISNPNSGGVRRIQDLAISLFTARRDGQPQISSLRYQLLTAAAGSLAYAVQNRASVAVLIVHEFITDKTSDRRHAKNAADYRAFLTRLDAEQTIPLVGPVRVPGAPLFTTPPSLLIGKLSTKRRSAEPEF